MSREITFRAWSEKENLFYYEAEKTYDCRCGGVGCDEQTFEHVLNDDNYTVEQFTGIYDRNNTPIYEGDIIAFPEGFEMSYYTSGVVIYDHGEFVIKTADGEDGTYYCVEFYDYNDPSEDFEVVGNIHEMEKLKEENA